ncbi:hypothetical protein [Polaribacter sp. HL-MS24]|uniref:hypothetical protein n=1 Tax=Polaribacter sp. HL-MS24 TaxID=3077735 RepID=UPI002934EAF8|nr:hypothetical protein [Polaribacter sp. HL-MS24]WOC39879.1 hypothetical protein RRF69_09635 [Polaribacter sp. HL-MS24]
MSKMNHYGGLRGKQLFEKGMNVNVFHFLIKPTARFLIHYFLRLGFLDGILDLYLLKLRLMEYM